MSSHEGVTIPEISAVSRGVVDDMIAELQAHGITPLAPVHFIYHGADGTLTTKFRLTIAFPIATPPGAADRGLPDRRAAGVSLHGGGLCRPDARHPDRLRRDPRRDRRSGRKRTPESREIYKKWIGFESPDNVTELQVGVA